MGRHSLSHPACGGAESSAAALLSAHPHPIRPTRTRRRPAHAGSNRAQYVRAAQASLSVGLMAASLATVAAPAALAVAGPVAAEPAAPARPESDPSAQRVSIAAPKVAKPAEAAKTEKRMAPSARANGKARPAGKHRAAERPHRHTHETDNVTRWIQQAIKIMRARGIAVSSADIPAIRTVIQRESSGNPRAINLWDINAKRGTPSKGLMQTIDPTFRAYRLAGFDDIYHPVHNIIAGVRYTLSRYGGFDNHPGLRSMARGQGYRGY